ncbi:MAG: flagellar biosynthetic protein FliO [Oscillospiraceae bacterium]|nr:flagellar biosynthetic protein FliO [Oscillospiraceae bacterium]
MGGTDLLSLLSILLTLALALLACYLVTRWMGLGLGSRLGAGGQHVRVLERVPVGRDQALVVVRAANRFFLLGSSPSGFSLLAELTEEELSASSSDGVPPEPPDFRALLRKFRAKK